MTINPKSKIRNSKLSLHLRQLIPIMVFLHHVFFVDGVVGKFMCGIIPFQFFTASIGDITHLGYRGYVCTCLYGAMQVVHFARFYYANKILPMLIHAIVRLGYKWLVYFMAALSFLDHFPAAPV